MNKLFDDTPYIDRNVVTSYDKRKWRKEFQKYCDSDEIRKESSHTGLNACGYWYACGECKMGRKYPCSSALIKYLSIRNVNIDYKNTNKEYLDKLLRLELGRMSLTKEECEEYKKELKFALDHIGTRLDDNSMKDAISLGIVGFEKLIHKHFDNPPFKTEWIPCNEKLPQPCEEVLVWFEYFRYGDYNCLYQTYGISQTVNNNGNVEFSGFINGESGWNNLRIIAWMPLPKPYKIVD